MLVIVFLVSVLLIAVISPVIARKLFPVPVRQESHITSATSEAELLEKQQAFIDARIANLFQVQEHQLTEAGQHE